jgi:uncharacterized protein YdcH (DUF465 family)
MKATVSVKELSQYKTFADFLNYHNELDHFIQHTQDNIQACAEFTDETTRRNKVKQELNNLRLSNILTCGLYLKMNSLEQVNKSLGNITITF